MQVSDSHTQKNSILVHSTDLENNKYFPFSCSGDYVCQISDKVIKDQVHTVEILGEFIKEVEKEKNKHLWTLKIFVITRLWKNCERKMFFDEGRR
jgi:hypothetical protein